MVSVTVIPQFAWLLGKWNVKYLALFNFISQGRKLSTPRLELLCRRRSSFFREISSTLGGLLNRNQTSEFTFFLWFLFRDVRTLPILWPSPEFVPTTKKFKMRRDFDQTLDRITEKDIKHWLHCSKQKAFASFLKDWTPSLWIPKKKNKDCIFNGLWHGRESSDPEYLWSVGTKKRLQTFFCWDGMINSVQLINRQRSR
jgi:hypothetical protein